MENKNGIFNWKSKNSSLVFGLSLAGVAALSVLLAMGQVRQAKREREEARLQNEASMQDMAKNNDTPYTSQLDDAIKNAMNQENGDSLSDQEDLSMAASASEAVQDMEGIASDLSAAAEIADDAGDNAGTIETTNGAGDITGAPVTPNEEEASTSAAASVASITAETVSTDGGESVAASASGENGGTSIAANSAGILPTVTFDEMSSLSWPVAGSVVLDYSMDQSIYFPTLNQYKYNPALVIGSDTGAQVVAAAKGIVENIGNDPETGTTIVMNLGNGYKLKYGQLKDITVSEGDVIDQGGLLGYVSDPTKYYCMEGSNLYFAMTKDEAPIDPVIYLE